MFAAVDIPAPVKNTIEGLCSMSFTNADNLFLSALAVS
jgi:hypothetical protein